MSINLAKIFGLETLQLNAGPPPVVAENPLVVSEGSTEEPKSSCDDPLDLEGWLPDGVDSADCFDNWSTLGGLCLRLPSDRNLTPVDHRSASKDCPLTRCDRCGSTDYRDVTIHGGRSTRRDCGQCNRFMGWPKWDGRG